VRCSLLILALLLAASTAAAEPPSQEDIDALERDLARTQDEDKLDELLPMLMEGLMERCFPADPLRANPVVHDDWSEGCLGRAVEVAERILERPDHPDRDRALFVAGKASIATRRAQAGAAYLTRFVEQRPGAEEAGLAHYALAELAADNGDHDAAIPHYRAAIEALPAPATVQPRYQLAWNLSKGGEARAAIDEMRTLLAMPDGLAEEPRAEALQDLENWLAQLGDAAVTADALRGCEGDRAVDAVERVAADRMAAQRWEVADAHYAALLQAWPGDPRASGWQVARVDAAVGAGDWAGTIAAASTLMEGYGPSSPHAAAHRGDAEHKRLALQVEETARSTIGTLHRDRVTSGNPTVSDLEGLYRQYLAAFPAASKIHEMRMALAALYQEDGQPESALDEMIAAVEASAGRERGAQAARLALEVIKPRLPDLQTTTPSDPMNPYEEQLLLLAEVFNAGYPRHGDGAVYALAAGRVRVLHGQLDEGCAQLLEVTRRYPTTPEARSAAAAAVHAHLDREDWPQTLLISDQLLGDSRLTAAHPDLAETLGQARSTAHFNQAVAHWDCGDPAGAAKAFEALAREQPNDERAPIALHYAATALHESGDTTRAGVLYRRVYTNYPDHELAPQAIEDQSSMRWAMEDMAGAASLLCKLQQTYPDHERAVWALYTAAWLYDQESRFDEAIGCYDLLIRTYPDAPESYESAIRLEELQE